ncbi:MAG: hypothetical protein MJ202_00200 [Lentisphaeria bacterium]|nr:hypothetical protein [Lentisphaeria bacterium]
MRPDEIFLYVSSAINRLGNTAEEQQNKIAVCGESILAVGNSLEKINGIGNDGIIPESAVAIKESFESIKNSAMGIAEKLGVFKLLEKAARQLEEANAEAKALKDKFTGNDKTPYKTWNETQVSEENKKAAAEYDDKYRNSQRQLWMSIPASARPLTPPALPIDKDGLTPGQAKYKYDPVTNPHGFKASTDSAPLTKEELSAAKAKLRSKREEEKKQDEKQKAVIAEQAAKDAEERRVKFEEALAEDRKTPYQKKIEAINADYGKKMAEATEIYGSQEKIPENVMSQLNWQRQTQLSEATASFQNAQMKNQRMFMRPIYNARINNAPRNVAGGGMDIRAMVEQQRRTNELLAKGNYIKVRN